MFKIFFKNEDLNVSDIDYSEMILTILNEKNLAPERYSLLH